MVSDRFTARTLRMCSVLVVLVGVLAACGGAPAAGDSATTAPIAATTAPAAAVATDAPAAAVATDAPVAAATAAPAEATAAPAANSGEKVQLRFAVLGQQAEEDNVKKFVAAFNKKYPNVDVTVEQQTGDYVQKIQLQAASNTLPDLFWIYDGAVKQFAEKGLMLDLDPLIKSTNFNTSDIYESMLALGQYDGKQYMIPRDYNHLVVWYNIDMFKAANVPLPKDGWTWDEFVTAAHKLTIKDASGKTTQYGVDGGNFSWWAVSVPAVRGFGGEVVGEDGKVAVNTPEAAKGIDALYQLVKDGVATNFAEKQTEGFTTGQAAMSLHVRPLMQTYVDASKGKFTFDVVTFPKFPVKAQVGTGTSGYAIAATSKHPQEAWELLSFIGSTEGQKIFSATGNAVPVLKSLQQDATWRSVPSPTLNHDAFFKFPEADTLPVEVRLPAAAGGPYDTARNELMEKVFLGQMTPQEMVAEWAKRIQQAIDDAK